MKDEKALLKGAEMIQKELRQQLRDQGHHLTGALERSIVNRVVINSEKGSTIEGVAVDYAGILDQGVTPGRIPYKDGSGAKTSKYIGGLITFFKLRGLDDKEAKQAAFATARKHKLEGMPTLASRRFSKNGVRTFFIEVTEISLGRKVDDTVMGEIDDLIDKKYNQTKSETI